MTEYTTNFIIDKEEFYEMAEKDYKDWVIDNLDGFDPDNQPEINFIHDQNEKLNTWQLNHKEAVYTARYFYEQFADMHRLWQEEYYKNNSKELQKLPF